MSRLALFLIYLTIASPASAADSFWFPLTRTARPDHTSLWGVRLPELAMRLAQPTGAEITLPLPDGRIERFRVVEVPLLGAAMRQSLPGPRAYEGRGVDDPSLSARLDLTTLGVRAMVSTPAGTAFIEPVERGRTDEVRSSWGGDRADDFTFECRTMSAPGAPRPTPGPHATSDLRSYRTVLIGTGEYTQYFGSVSAATAELFTSLNRVNAIFERDLGIHLEGVGLLAFPDPATDPFLPEDFLNPDASQAIVDSIYGPDGYDVAQEIVQQGTGFSLAGVSSVPAACTPYRAGSWVSVGTPTANDFTIKVMAHELGHTLGAFHTGSCGGQIVAGTVEPGSGSTMMGRAGRCPPNDVVPSPGDLYFNSWSIDEIQQAAVGTTNCFTAIATGNSSPTCDAGPDYTIPRGTPFALTGGGFDPDPGDVITYCWEQRDVAASNGDSITGPLFRSRLPSLSPTRLLPALATVLADTVDRWERLPQADRLLHFRLTILDNHVGGGAVAWDDKTITVSGVPFAVTSPNGGESIPSGPFTVTWDIGGGAVAATVNILLSTDGGATWSSLAANTPNDGSQDVTRFTAVTLDSCRIKVEAVGNIFYDVSHANFAILGGATDVEPGANPIAFALRNDGPNPSDRHAAVRIDLPRASVIHVGIFSVSGRKIRSLADGAWPAGSFRLPWAGDADSGGRAPAGTYFVRMSADDWQGKRKITLY